MAVTNRGENLGEAADALLKDYDQLGVSSVSNPLCNLIAITSVRNSIVFSLYRVYHIFNM